MGLRFRVRVRGEAPSIPTCRHSDMSPLRNGPLPMGLRFRVRVRDRVRVRVRVRFRVRG